jgi:hypothetical protein
MPQHETEADSAGGCLPGVRGCKRGGVRRCRFIYRGRSVLHAGVDAGKSGDAVGLSPRPLWCAAADGYPGTPEAGSTATTFYTLLGSCLRSGPNTRDYLIRLFARLPTDTN